MSNKETTGTMDITPTTEGVAYVCLRTRSPAQLRAADATADAWRFAYGVEPDKAPAQQYKAFADIFEAERLNAADQMEREASQSGFNASTNAANLTVKIPAAVYADEYGIEAGKFLRDWHYEAWLIGWERGRALGAFVMGKRPA